jgi:hypothetical protein
MPHWDYQQVYSKTSKLEPEKYSNRFYSCPKCTHFSTFINTRNQSIALRIYWFKKKIHNKRKRQHHESHHLPTTHCFLPSLFKIYWFSSYSHILTSLFPPAQPAAPTHSLPLLPKNILLSLVTPNKQNKHKIPLPCFQSHSKSCLNIREI